jgi:hypothetical protein
VAGTATVHPHHLPHVTIDRKTLRFGWPHKAAAGLMVLVGLSFVAITVFANLYQVGPAFDRMSNGFRPTMTEQSIQTARADITGLAAAGTEIQTKLLPTLATQLSMTPDQLSTFMTTQFPAVAAGLAALPSITPQFSGLVNTLDAQRPYFAAADAIPTKSLPATTVPWSLLAVGLVAAGLGVLVWFRPRGSAIIATLVGAALIVTPLALSMPHKASYADTLNRNLTPVYTQQLITQSSSALTTLSTMGTQMQNTMLPALATQLHLQPAQLETFLGQNFPATASALNRLPAAMTRFQRLVATFNTHLSDFNTLKPVKFVPIVWSMIIGGIALFLLGGAGVLITSGRKPQAQELTG